MCVRGRVGHQQVGAGEAETHINTPGSTSLGSLSRSFIELASLQLVLRADCVKLLLWLEPLLETIEEG